LALDENLVVRADETLWWRTAVKYRPGRMTPQTRRRFSTFARDT
jgi:hypothetical protein